MSKCEYRYVCPVEECSEEKSLSCIGALLDHIEKYKERKKKTEAVETEIVEAAERGIFFVCDHRACDSCDSKQSGCTHTLDVRHAKNFQMSEENFFEG